jgi:hypothetical protein
MIDFGKIKDLIDVKKVALDAFCAKIISQEIETPEGLLDASPETEVAWPSTIVFQNKVWPIKYDAAQNIVSVDLERLTPPS